MKRAFAVTPIAMGAATAVTATPQRAQRVSVDDIQQFKNKGNEAIHGKHFHRAIEVYTQGLAAAAQVQAVTAEEKALVPKVAAVLYANRAVTHIKLEEYDSAVKDATMAIEVNPDYAKGYYRRATAHYAMGHYAEAIGDFAKVVSLVPQNRQAQKKLEVAKAEVARLDFERAIEVEHQADPSVFDMIDIDGVEVPPDYDGRRWDSGRLPLKFIVTMMLDFKEQKQVHVKYAYKILRAARDVLKRLPNVVELVIPEGRKLTVCGDTHGQFYDVLNLFKLNGLPSSKNPYLFNGDFVDRGSFSMEVVLTFLALKVKYPSSFHLARGNHETLDMNRIYGFQPEVLYKYDRVVFDMLQEVFNLLPLAHVVNSTVFITHGGLCSQDFVTIDDINAVNRVCQPPDEGIMADLLWSDPQPELGRSPSKRGISFSFGPDVTRRFLDHNGFKYVIRSHQVQEEGYLIEHDGDCITVFSAPNYCDQLGNLGAFITLYADCEPHFTQFTAVAHPDVPPMAYSCGTGLLDEDDDYDDDDYEDYADLLEGNEDDGTYYVFDEETGAIVAVEADYSHQQFVAYEDEAE